MLEDDKNADLEEDELSVTDDGDEDNEDDVVGDEADEDIEDVDADDETENDADEEVGAERSLSACCESLHRVRAKACTSNYEGFLVYYFI